MKKITFFKLVILLLLVSLPVIAMAVDEAIVQQIQTDAATAKSDAANAKNKADGNDSKITGLYDNVVNLQNQIDNIQLTPGPRGQQGAQGEQGPIGLTGGIGVYDANGQYLCQFTRLISSTALSCFIESVGGIIKIVYDSGNFVGRTGNLWFESNDCTGQPYVDFGLRFHILKINDFHTTSYFQIKSAPIILLSVNSYIDPFGICSPDTFERNVFPVEEVTLPFTFPIPAPLSLE